MPPTIRCRRDLRRPDTRRNRQVLVRPAPATRQGCREMDATPERVGHVRVAEGAVMA